MALRNCKVLRNTLDLHITGEVLRTPFRGRLNIFMRMFFSSDSFVKVYLLQGGKKVSKKKTSTKRDERNATFNEAMIFSVPANALQVSIR